MIDDRWHGHECMMHEAWGLEAKGLEEQKA